MALYVTFRPTLIFGEEVKIIIGFTEVGICDRRIDEKKKHPYVECYVI